MRCFGGVFQRYLCGLGGLGESGGRVVPFERSSDRFAIRFCIWRMPTSQSLERPGLSVESSRIPGWRYLLGSTGVAVMMSGQLAPEFPNQTNP